MVVRRILLAMSPEATLKRAAAKAARLAAQNDKAREELLVAILAARRSGMTLERIGEIVGVTRQRVRQIVREAGLR